MLVAVLARWQDAVPNGLRDNVMNASGSSSSKRPADAAIVYANLAHFYSHLLMLVYPTVVLALGGTFGLSYGKMLSLSLPGYVLFGIGAFPAGWLGDRWSGRGMMAAFFLGSGASAILTGFATGPLGITLGLAAIGLFASIYHPVGTAVVGANAVNRGRALGLNGFCGSAGIAAAPLMAGTAIAGFGWRAAFVIPGVVCLATGVVYLLGARETTAAAGQRPVTEAELPRRAALRGLAILMVTALSIGLIAQAIMVGLPKVFEVRVSFLNWAGLAGTGGLVTLALCFSMVGQLLGGRLADRFPLKTVYLGTYAVMAPLALASAVLVEAPLVAASAALMMLTSTGLPAENTLIARYCPADWHARAYGLKFVLSLGVAALAVPMVGAIYDGTGGFFWLYVAIAGFAAVIVAAGLFLPGLRTERLVAAE